MEPTLTPATSAMCAIVAASKPSRSRICTVASKMAPTVACARAWRGSLRTVVLERPAFIAHDYRARHAPGPFAFGSAFRAGGRAPERRQFGLFLTQLRL